MRSFSLVSIAFLAAGLLAAACSGGGRRDVFDGEAADDDAAAPTGDDDGTGDSGPTLGSSGGSSGQTQLPACATAKATAQRVPIYLDVVLDGSRSMDGYTNAAYENTQATMCEPGTYQKWNGADPGICYLANAREDDPLQAGRRTGKKWLAARGSLKAFFDAKAAAADPGLGVGLFLFSSTASPASDSYVANGSQPNAVPVALLDTAHAAQLWNVVDPGTWPDLGTPLTATIDAEAEKLRGFTGEDPLLPEGRRVILLITDGVPDTANLKDPVKTAVTNALEGEPSVATAVIGIGNPGDNPDTVYDAAFLSKLAKLGGVAADGCDDDWHEGSSTPSCHLQVTPGASSADQLQAQFSAALDAIAGSLASCELALDKTAPIDPTKVNVIYVDASGTASQIEQSGDSGWTYDDDADPSSVILHGAACSAYRSGGGNVDIVVGCPTGTSVVN